VVFLDKDGTLVEDIPYNVVPGRIRLAPGAAEGVQALAAAGFRLAVVTNQSGVARGYFPETALAGVEARLRELLADIGVPLAGFFYCPHHPGGTVAGYATACRCRKPAPGMVLAAASSLGADLAACWVVGDAPTDIAAGRQAGCRTVQVGRDAESADPDWTKWIPDFRAVNLAAAAIAILTASRRHSPAG
jgi:histidinol-phosphate phosphatase family protein